MASLDFSSGSIVSVYSGSSGSLVPTRVLPASRLVPVSKISRYDTALVAANDHFICYPTAKSGVVRVISQEDASHLTLVSGGQKIRDLAISDVGPATWVSVLVELDGDEQRIQSWRLKNGGPLSDAQIEAQTAIAVESGRSVSQIRYAQGSTVLVAAFVGDDATPSLEAYDAAHAALVAHQACLARVADVTVTWTAQAHLAVAIALLEDGSVNVWNLPIEQKKFTMYRLDAPVMTQPQSVSIGGLLMFDRKLGVLDPTKLSQFKCVVDFKSTLKPRTYRLLHFERKYAIVVDTANSQLVVVKIDPVDSTLLSIAALKMPSGVEMLDVAVTKNLDAVDNNDAFDAYIFHSKGLSILQVTQEDLAVDGSTVLRAASSRANSPAIHPASAPGVRAESPGIPANVPSAPANVPSAPANVPSAPANVLNAPASLPSPPAKKNNNRKKPVPRNSSSEGSLDYDRIVEMVTKKLLESGQFVTRKRFDDLRKKYEELANRIETLSTGSEQALSKTESPRAQKDGKWSMGSTIWGPIGGAEQHGSLYRESTAAASGAPSVGATASPSSFDGDMLPLASSTLSPSIAARKEESPIRGLWNAPPVQQATSVGSSPGVSIASVQKASSPTPSPVAVALAPADVPESKKPVEALVKELVAAAGTESFNVQGAKIFKELDENYSAEDMVATNQIYVVLSAIACVSMLFRDLATPKQEVDARIRWLGDAITAVSKRDLGAEKAVADSTFKKVSEEASKYLFEIPTAYMAISPLKIKIDEIIKS
ncbi:hypothetical protein TRVA0_046S00628 [Trichomonascus vanleenenianus]|uniref:uncharacterized protein n=1 Tax=Trichomonascus vanleenenianus TaxID=2268995 RepID=UPI003EC9D2B5